MARSTNQPEVDRALDELERSLGRQIRDVVSPVVLVFGTSDLGTTASDRFLQPFDCGTAAGATELQIPAFRAGTLRPFGAYIQTTGSAAGDRTVSLVVRVNGVDTIMHAQFTCPKFRGVLRATASIVVKRDDLISVVVRKSGSLTGAPALCPLYLEIA